MNNVYANAVLKDGKANNKVLQRQFEKFKELLEVEGENADD